MRDTSTEFSDARIGIPPFRFKFNPIAEAARSAIASRGSGLDLERARGALRACNPNCPRDEWVQLAMAAKAAGLDEDLFHGWSAGGDSYKERDTRAMWKSIKSDGGIGPGTLYKIAAEHGWAPERPKPPAKAPAGAVAAPMPSRPSRCSAT